MSEHARLSASSAHRWMNCAGSARMEAGLPDVDTEYNVEGRAAHQLAASFLTSKTKFGWPTTVCVRLKEGGHATVTVTNEMVRAVEVYADVVLTVLRESGPRAVMFVEKRVSLEKLGPPEEMFGTADAVIVGPGLIHVVDLKYGTGVVVEVKENPQLMEYALAAKLTLNTTAIAGPNPLFRTTIVQPRAEHPDGPIRSHEYTFTDLREFGHRLMAGARAAHAPDAPLSPGPWCRWCKGAGFCPALASATQAAAQAEFGVSGMAGTDKPAPKTHKVERVFDVALAPIPDAEFGTSLAEEEIPTVKAMNATVSTALDRIQDAEFEVLPPDPDRLPVGVVAKVLEKAELIEGFLAAVRERARREIADGRDVPGWKLVEGRPVREWVNEEDVRAWAQASEIVEGELYERKLRSPAQMEKTVGKKNVPPDLWRKVSKSVKLAPVSDSRPAIASKAQDEFAVLSPAPDPTHAGGNTESDA